MMDWYYDQKENAKPITEEILAKLKIKNYSSGRPINVGDIVLYGLLVEDDDKPVELANYATFTNLPEGAVNPPTTQLKLTLLTFHIDELNKLYKSLDNPHGSLPRFQRVII